MGRNDSVAHIPGAWLQAAAAFLPESLAANAYVAMATQSGLAPLRGTDLNAERSQHVMGLYRRAELVSAAGRTLQAIRTTIPSDTTRARFDRLFRPGGDWVVDLHDAALAWARTRAPGIGWQSARRSLASTRWIDADDDTSDDEGVPRALYGLAVLAANDSAGFARARTDLLRTDPSSATAALLLLKGYTEGQRWYADALGFFLNEAWLPAGQSIGDHVRADWQRSELGDAGLVPEMPDIRSRLFGYPQAVPQYGVPPALFQRLVRKDNPSAAGWIERHGQSELLRALRRLPPGDTSLTLLRTGGETIRLTTIPRQSRESLNGFLEPRDAIVIDPGYSPLLALGAVVHEWQHLAFRRQQLQAFASRLTGTGSTIVLPTVEPHLAEGFAEWSTERILAPVVQRWPLLGLGELEKRAALSRGGADDPHATGYALVRALAAQLGTPAATTDVLLRYAEDPSGIMAEPALARAWRRHRQIPARALSAPFPRMLIPEVTFTIEDGFPDVVATRILVPTAPARSR
jgi:hypothetical protein